MSSGFSGGYADFCNSDGVSGRYAVNMMNTQGLYRRSMDGNMSDPASLIQQRSYLIGKRSLADFQQQFQQQQELGMYLRNVKQRVNYPQHPSPISTLSPPVDSSLSPEFSSNSAMCRYGVPVYQQSCGLISGIGNGRFSDDAIISNTDLDLEKKMMSQRLQELEKELLDDNDDEEQNDYGSVLTNSEWSETIQNLIGSDHNKPISAASSSSSSSPSTHVVITSPKQSLIDAASAISDGKNDVAVDALTRLTKLGNTRGTAEQRLVSYMASALMSRVNCTEYSPSISELYAEDHAESIQMMYEISPCFKLGLMAANSAILEAVSGPQNGKLHVVDFDIGQGRQYMHLLHALAANANGITRTLKITAICDYKSTGLESRLKFVRNGLNAVATKVGVNLIFNVLESKITELNRDVIKVQYDEVLVVNLAFKLFKLPDESVTTENLRDELLHRVKALSPTVVTVVEQELNGNTAPFVTRVAETLEYYGALFESLDSTLPVDSLERVKIEEGLSRKMCNSVACEGRDRVERCEVFGKWRARMGMAGFEAKQLSQNLSGSLRVKLNSGTRGNPGFTVNEETGGVSFGWMGRTLTVASAWK